MIESSLGTSLDVLATVYLSQGDYDRAKSVAIRSLTIREKPPDGKQIDTAVSLEMLGLIEMRGGHQDKALPHYTKALELRESVMHENSQSIGNNLLAICFIYLNDERFNNATLFESEKYFIKLTKFRERVHGPASPETMFSLVGHAELLDRLGRTKDLADMNKRIEEIENNKKALMNTK